MTRRRYQARPAWELDRAKRRHDLADALRALSGGVLLALIVWAALLAILIVWAPKP